MTEKYFFTVNIEDLEIEAHLNAIKFFCDPTEKWPAHITVRGPYKTRIQPRKSDELVKSASISVIGAGHFFDDAGHQNTVYLRCGFENLRDIWDKPDYNLNPHITIYDGDNRKFAFEVFNVLKDKKLFFQVRSSGVEEMKSFSGQYEFRFYLDKELVRKVTGIKDIEKVTQMRLQDRLRYIEKLSESFSNIIQSHIHDEVGSRTTKH